MKSTKILYWVFTILFCLVMVASSIPDVIASKDAAEGFRQIGMPAYLLVFLGVAKLLGVIAILIPGYPRLKEWAYAGLIYDVVGATYAIISIGMPAANYMIMFVILAIGFCSYIFYHRKRIASA